jgi:hypothetical protein
MQLESSPSRFVSALRLCAHGKGHMRATKDEGKPILAAGSVSVLIRESHVSAHIEHLPVQVIEERTSRSGSGSSYLATPHQRVRRE